tara:strand:+ start:63 stop:959 length:897 start_codon:yes stop_codon:yes gene_type:complete
LPQIGTVIRRTKNFYYIDIGESDLRLCHIKANLFHGNPKKNLVAVGDKVEIDTTEADKAGWILKILSRRTLLSRRQSADPKEQILVSNADRVLVVASIRNPPFRNGLVDRFFVAGSCGGLENILVLSKADLSNEEEISSIKNLYLSLGYKILVTSVTESRGIESLRDLLHQHTTVLCGHSGVGKSSLIKALYPNWNIRIGDVSRKSGKGRHITRMAEMYRIPSGGFIVDTPGIREFQPIVSQNELDKHFVEFVPYLGKCRFKGCTHRHEPQCAIKEAYDEGKISEIRFKSYLGIYESI